MEQQETVRCGYGRLPEELESKPRTSPSGLMCFRQSPKHFKSRYIDGEKHVTPAMKLGTAIHTALLEPEKFDSEYAFEPRKTDYPEALITADDLKKACKDLDLKVTGTKATLAERLKEAGSDKIIWEDFVKETIGHREPLKADVKDDFEGIKKSIAEHPTAKNILVDGEAEKSIFYTHEPTGVILRGRMDYYVDKNGTPVIIDLKKVRTAEPRAFQRTIFSMGLHIQAAVYLEAMTQITGVEHETFIWLCVEDKPPYMVQPMIADFGMIEKGKHDIHRYLVEWLECKKTNKWRGYSDSILNVSLPDWAFSEPDDFYADTPTESSL